jgi:hypothetical protein
MVIPGDEIIYRTAIGKQGDATLWAVGTCGGLHLIEARAPSGTKKILGVGSHRGVARHIAKRNNPDVEFTILEKSLELNENDFKDVLPFWELVTKKTIEKLNE